MPRVASFHLQQTPEYSCFVLRDSEADTEGPDDGPARAAARASVLGAARHHAYLQTAQRSVHVHVGIELWDTAPPETVTEAWDERHDATMTCPTGSLYIENITAGPVPLEPGGDTTITLPPGVTDIHLRLYARGLDVADEVNDAFDRARGLPFEQLRAELEPLNGRERYLIQIWPA